MNRHLPILILIAVLAAWVPPVDAQSASVVVDGRMVGFDQPPALIEGRLLIPLRGVFERLGAQVEWQPSPGIVVARRGATVIVLQPGNRTARVDDRAVPLDVPAVIVNGRTLVPLRFVGEALGARVDWDAANRVVYVTSPGQVGQPGAPPPVAPAPVPPPAPPVVAPPPVAPPPVGPPPVAPPPQAPAPISLDGTVVRIDPYTAPPRIHVLSQGAISIVPIAPEATVFLTEVNAGRGGAASVEQIRRGDFARVLIDGRGRAVSIRASYRHVVGRLDRLTSRRVVLADGQILTLAADVIVTVDGREVARNAAQPGMVVMLRVNPQTNEVWEMHARTTGAPAPPVAPPPVVPPGPAPPVVPTPIPVRIEAVGLNSPGPFGVGATLTVTMRGTPGGEAFLDVGQQATSLRMQEGPAGQYAVGYTVRPGEAVRAQVVVKLRVVGVEVSRALGTVVIDGLPPTFTSIQPEPNSTVTSVQPTIVAGFADRGPAGMRTDSVRFWLDGREERRATVGATSVSYVPPAPLSVGQHRVQVVVADLAGNEASTTWTFAVSPPPSVVVAPTPTPAPSVVRIENVGLSAAGPFGIGATFTVTMRGSPGGEAFLDVGQTATNLRMQEGPAGQYTAGYTVRPGEATRAQVVVRLRLGGVETSRAIGAVVMDGVPPAFTSAQPEPNSTVTSAQPTIMAGFADRGPAGIRTDSVRLWLDGREERRATVGATSVSYVPPAPLSVGQHRVQVVVADLAGNEASTTWTFAVSPPSSVVVAPSPVAPPSVIKTPSAPATPTPVRTTPTTVPPASVPTARVSPTPGVAPPVISSPKQGDAIVSPLAVRGTGIPGSRVQVTIDYESAARTGPRGTLGPILVSVAQDGSWDVRVPLPERLGEGRLVITAVTLSGNLRSEPARATIIIVIPQRDPEK